jgi:L-alanine-DL-glutamate epimerase-like enolase superfamily enzyme
MAQEFSERTLIVAVTSGDYTGYGEAAATSYYGISTEGMMIAAIKR